jgi:hypothetical protein
LSNHTTADLSSSPPDADDGLEGIKEDELSRAYGVSQSANSDNEATDDEGQQDLHSNFRVSDLHNNDFKISDLNALNDEDDSEYTKTVTLENTFANNKLLAGDQSQRLSASGLIAATVFSDNKLDGTLYIEPEDGTLHNSKGSSEKLSEISESASDANEQINTIFTKLKTGRASPTAAIEINHNNNNNNNNNNSNNDNNSTSDNNNSKTNKNNDKLENIEFSLATDSLLLSLENDLQMKDS